ncbi:alpha-glucan family phosphorylase [Nitrospira moscoviensis]|uniref:Putative glycogen phosphorylase n=1 Tax=Nitrospira moscoviensis TaxID=42253 RepID=A0A0K2GBV3_NITMO|nr:alpha-glucan family phosphorylase [Nitrospira moscoviensis]ALA58354.1 putative glycogen phosphorylase [Nitrospira moscoviensis]
MISAKDPVCGMTVFREQAMTAAYEGRTWYFCSELCRRSFLADPERYLGAREPSEIVSPSARRIAYFTMEAALDPAMPTYSGGLGVLAGDTLRSCADLKIPVVGVSLLYWKGYFEQKLDEWGNQQEHPVTWEPGGPLRLLPVTVSLTIEGRTVVVQAWQYEPVGVTGGRLPVLLLDTNRPENAPEDRELTFWLYGGDERYRLAQEIVLGIGGVRMLQALGYTEIDRFHMNEGHAALLTLQLLRDATPVGSTEWDFAAVRRRCVFTTHTPVPAGHDQFAYDLVRCVMGDLLPLEVLQMLGGRDRLNMTLLGFNMSTHINGVAKRHGEVSQEMFPGYAIDSITNGIHSVAWTSEPFRQLYDRAIPGWRTDPFSLRYAISLSNQDIWDAHVQAKTRLLDEVRRRTQRQLNLDAFTIGFARRATLYKRADLLLSAPHELIETVKQVGALQILFAGKAHPKDEPGKEMIRRVVQAAKQLERDVTILYLDNYELLLARLMTAGVDLWLNTPQRPLEASGTSGMKAAHNGVPSLSVLDGWWLEGHIEGVTGWSIGSRTMAQKPDQPEEARELYQKLRWTIMPMYYRSRDHWIDVMRQTIALNASFFNTHRMVQQYAANAYV